MLSCNSYELIDIIIKRENMYRQKSPFLSLAEVDELYSLSDPKIQPCLKPPRAKVGYVASYVSEH